MSCRSNYCDPIGPAAIVAVLLTLMTTTGCGRKGDPLPPLREPDPVAETAPSEAIPAEDEAAEPEEEEAAADGDEEAEDEPDGEDGEATPP